MGLSTSAVLSTLARSTIALLIPETVPVNVGLFEGALVPMDVATSAAKVESLLIAIANSFKVFSNVGAPPTKSFTAVCTNAVVAICVVLVEDDAVGAVGTPVRDGDANGAFVARAVCVAVEIGLFTSAVLSTLARSTIALLIPETVPENVGLFNVAYLLIKDSPFS
uniref:Uncharacterized protein n=1 Tax=viral metagenome TaxID=1070528 RepID=A0A6C0I561_9ZZZZ